MILVGGNERVSRMMIVVTCWRPHQSINPPCRKVNVLGIGVLMEEGLPQLSELFWTILV